jgi:hypothetical protein
LVWLRENVLETLLYRESDGDDDGYLSLCDLERSLRARHAAFRARKEASATIARATPVEQPRLSVERIVELLDNADYRLVRSDDDLLEAVLETLGRINNDISHDLAMLYAKPARVQRTRRHKALRRPNGRQHLEEDALQSYIRRRLVDLLPRVVDPGVKVELLREDQVRHRRRLDLRILAPCLDANQACVIIEIKWSDNRKVGTSLTEQLGTQYLLGEQRTHGIYLVGWCGTCGWTRNRKHRSRQELPQALVRQARRFCQRHRNRHIRIEAFVLDAEWREGTILEGR